MVELLDPADDEPVVADVVDLLHRAVDPGLHPGQDRASRWPAPGSQSMPSKRSSASLAKRQHSSTWSSARMFTQNAPLGPISCQLSEVKAGRKPTSGGSRETEVNDPMVSPDGLGGWSEPGGGGTSPVTTVTPVGKWPSTWRKRRESNGTRARH